MNNHELILIMKYGSLKKAHTTYLTEQLVNTPIFGTNISLPKSYKSRFNEEEIKLLKDYELNYNIMK